MAEALGLAASVIAVVDITAKAVKLSVKLRSLWNEAKDIPATLLEKAEELQDIEEFLSEAECQSTVLPIPHSVWNDKFMQRAIAKARAAMSDLQKTIDDLNAQVTDKRRYRRKFAAAKVLIQKDSLEAMERKLDRALGLFKMTQGLYCATMTNLCTSVIVQRLPGPLDTSNGPSAKTGRIIKVDDAEHFSTGKLGLGKVDVPDAIAITTGSTVMGRLNFGFGNQSCYISMRSPDWLCRTVYSFVAKRSFSGWQFSLSACPVVDWYNDVVDEVVREDDVALLKKCLYNNSLTPFVHNYAGQNLLHLATETRSVQIARWLLGIGLQSGSFSEYQVVTDDEIIITKKTPLDFFFWHNFDNARTWVEMLKLFQTFAPDTVAADSDTWYLVICEKSLSSFRNIQKLLAPDYFSFELKWRLQHASMGIDTALWSWSEVLYLLPEARPLKKDFVVACKVNFRGGLTSLVASGMGLQFSVPNRNQGEPETGRSFVEALGEILRLDPEEISPLWDNRLGTEWTPFCYMISRMIHTFDNYPPDIVDHAIQSAILIWATTLHENGIDLLEYGRRENEYYQRSGFFPRRGRSPGWLWNNDYVTKKHSREYLIAIMGITYGPLPEQWRLWWTPADMGFAGEFWNMVENPFFNIPGSWNDDFDEVKGGDYDLNTSGLDWDENNVPRMIWSEYRKIKPPV